MRDAILRRWYGQPGWLLLFWPLELIFAIVVRLRRMAYQHAWLNRVKLPVPVIVVGNLSVGGNGKTPLVLALAEHLRAAGWHPGIISRGYGSMVRSGYHHVMPDDDAVRVGDEPLLLARRSAVPVYIGPDRSQVAKALLQAHSQIDVLISDDGLQHYALGRDLDIVVMDAQRRLGNGHLLPVGPLREPGYRLREFCVVYHGDEAPLQSFRM
ncbi:MAG: tetraacyldisaccharide 4'-kinase, partial [Pseudomonadales bacterium]|nr:tetraacyldisaccharide 4'-kinase [Pseudomonadales bacterium]